MWVSYQSPHFIPFAHLCVFVCVYVRVYACACVRVRVCMYVCVCTCVYICVCVYVCVGMCVMWCGVVWCVRACTQLHEFLCVLELFHNILHKLGYSLYSHSNDIIQRGNSSSQVNSLLNYDTTIGYGVFTLEKMVKRVL